MFLYSIVCFIFAFECFNFLLPRSLSCDESFSSCLLYPPDLTLVTYVFYYLIAFVNISLHVLKVILCASEQICLIVRYCYRSFKHDPLHVLTDVYVLVLVDIDQNIFVCGRSPSLPSDIHKSIIYAYHCNYLNIVNIRKLV